MRLSFFIRLLACVVIATLFLYLYVRRTHRIDELRIDLPALVQEITILQEKNAVLEHEIARFESPQHLLELHRRFPHLKYPREDEVMILED